MAECAAPRGLACAWRLVSFAWQSLKFELVVQVAGSMKTHSFTRGPRSDLACMLVPSAQILWRRFGISPYHLDTAHIVPRVARLLRRLET